MPGQVYLAPSPATAQCLTPEECAWLQKRQNEAIVARNAAAGHSSVKGALLLSCLPCLSSEKHGNVFQHVSLLRVL